LSKIDLNKYKEFVLAVCSDPSKDLTTFMDRLDLVDSAYDVNTQSYGPEVNVPLLLTSAIGMAAETGEFCEIPKKIFFQGKQLNEDARFHMKRELGDVIWYWMNACNALGLDPNDVIAENVKKLEARYPGGSFDAHYSENRQEGDL
jgi:NTP pyrophosphatase (non-canonical NTP hydrolase)